MKNAKEWYGFMLLVSTWAISDNGHPVATFFLVLGGFIFGVFKSKEKTDENTYS